PNDSDVVATAMSARPAVQVSMAMSSVVALGSLSLSNCTIAVCVPLAPAGGLHCTGSDAGVSVIAIASVHDVVLPEQPAAANLNQLPPLLVSSAFVTDKVPFVPAPLLLIAMLPFPVAPCSRMLKVTSVTAMTAVEPPPLRERRSDGVTGSLLAITSIVERAPAALGSNVTVKLCDAPPAI